MSGASASSGGVDNAVHDVIKENPTWEELHAVVLASAGLCGQEGQSQDLPFYTLLFFIGKGAGKPCRMPPRIC